MSMISMDDDDDLSQWSGKELFSLDAMDSRSFRITKESEDLIDFECQSSSHLSEKEELLHKIGATYGKCGCDGVNRCSNRLREDIAAQDTDVFSVANLSVYEKDANGIITIPFWRFSYTERSCGCKVVFSKRHARGCMYYCVHPYLYSCTGEVFVGESEEPEESEEYVESTESLEKPLE